MKFRGHGYTQWFKPLFSLAGLLFAASNTWAQMPEDLPNQPQPIQIDSVLKVVIFIIIPIIMIASLFLWRRRSRKKREETENQQDQNEQ